MNLIILAHYAALPLIEVLRPGWEKFCPGRHVYIQPKDEPRFPPIQYRYLHKVGNSSHHGGGNIERLIFAIAVASELDGDTMIIEYDVGIFDSSADRIEIPHLVFGSIWQTYDDNPRFKAKYVAHFPFIASQSSWRSLSKIADRVSGEEGFPDRWMCAAIDLIKGTLLTTGAGLSFNALDTPERRQIAIDHVRRTKQPIFHGIKDAEIYHELQKAYAE